MSLFKNYLDDPGYNTVTRYIHVKETDDGDTIHFKFCHEAPWNLAKEHTLHVFFYSSTYSLSSKIIILISLFNERQKML